MEKQAEKTAPGDATIRKTLQEAWTQGSSTSRNDLSLNLELISRGCLTNEQSEIYYRLLLVQLVRDFQGERSFLFLLKPRRDGTPEIITTLGVDLDGDDVSSPERKVSPTCLFEAATDRRPFFRSIREHGDEEELRGSSLIVLPACSSDGCMALMVVENRFQDLTVEKNKVEAALLYSQHLAWQLNLDFLTRENESLWTDLARLRDSAGEESKSTTLTSHQNPPSRRSQIEKRKGLQGDYSFIVGSSPKLVEVLQVIDKISGSIAPVLISGESGTGKELIALAVHQNSPRKRMQFVSENCAAITETLLESELFGYVKGAFTGANKDHKGLFEVADGGTLFLDEVGDMSPSMQKKLLRVLQEGVIRRVGAKETTPVDVRIISATNKDLLGGCQKDTFREDLYYRLNVINLGLPPLRERREDIEEIAKFFIEDHAKTSGLKVAIDPAALERLAQFSWPGNIRELQNEIRKMCALCDEGRIRLSDLSDHLIAGEEARSLSDWPRDLAGMTLKEAIETLEREMIRKALRETDGNKSLVAKTLSIPKTSLYNKINKYKLS